MLADAYDKSSYFITCSFFDEEGEPVQPISAKWTLTNGNGQLVNAQNANEIAEPIGTSTVVALSGLDLVAGTSRAANTRCLTVEATYISAVTGDEMPLNKEATFRVIDLKGI